MSGLSKKPREICNSKDKKKESTEHHINCKGKKTALEQLECKEWQWQGEYQGREARLLASFKGAKLDLQQPEKMRIERARGTISGPH